MVEKRGSLWVEPSDSSCPCDGCRSEIGPDALQLTGIESCCGGCYRVLCRKCVEWAHAQFNKSEEK